MNPLWTCTNDDWHRPQLTHPIKPNHVIVSYIATHVR
jgi:hypothetical protein